MAAIWTPANTDPLIIAQEDETDVSAVITVESDQVPPGDVGVVSLSSVPALPPQVVLDAAIGSLTINFPNFVDVFPIQELRYLRNGVEGVVTRWADLPADAEDVLVFKPDPNNIREFVITAEAEVDGVVETQDYVIRLFANYNLGRDQLLAAVDARR